jgi:hypothetical protein
MVKKGTLSAMVKAPKKEKKVVKKVAKASKVSSYYYN